MTHKWIPPPFFVADKEICTMMNKQSVYAHTGNGFFFFLWFLLLRNLCACSDERICSKFSLSTFVLAD